MKAAALQEPLTQLGPKYRPGQELTAELNFTGL
jgi:hypothetical protein